jgi:hypothetical protein
VTLKTGPFRGRAWWFVGREAIPVSAWTLAGTWVGEYSPEGYWSGALVPHVAAKPKRKKRKGKQDGVESVAVES